MGLTIHYSARIKNLNLLPQFVAEVADICQTMGWENEEVDTFVEMEDEGVTFKPPLDDDKNIHLRGIYFTPTGCESVIFTFLSSGWTSSPINLMCAKSFQNIGKNRLFKGLTPLVYMIHTKTQYGGIDVHIALVHLFKYLEKKYFNKMDVGDEGGYWESGDKTILQERFDEYTQLISSFKSALEKENWTVTHDPFPLTTKMGDWLDKRDGDGE